MPPARRTALVTGPVTGARRPWGAPNRDLGPSGYVCEEYLVEGTATGYENGGDGLPSPDGRWTAVEIGRAPYRTRLLVVRPRERATFNGTVLVQWQNVSAGFESGRPDGDALYEGYAWVGVSAQQAGLYGLPMGTGPRGARGVGSGAPLVDADPERYGSLVHPGEPACFDIFAQAARAVGPERLGPVDPLGGLEVGRLLAVGASQSAMRLVAYANGLHGADQLFDGYLLSVWEGRAPRLDDGPVASGGVPVRVRDDLGIPVLVVNSEFEAPATARLGIADTDSFRLWEVAGTAHAPGTPIGAPDPGRWAPNPLSWAPVHEAAVGHLDRWVRDGVAPPAQRPIATEGGARAAIRRDDLGNAVGGIRLPELEVPIGEYRGLCLGTGQAPLFGGYRPFAPLRLDALYPSAADYVSRWGAAVDRLVASGALRGADAPPMRARARDVAAALG